MIAFKKLPILLVCLFVISIPYTRTFGAAAINFNDGNYVRVEDSSSLDITGAITLEAWIYKTWNGEDWNIIFSKPWYWDGDPWHVYRMGLIGVGDVPKPALCSFALSTGSTGVGSTSIIPDNAWVHLACSYDGSTMKMYVNGALEASAPAAGTILTNTQPLIIGRNLLNTWNDWFGRIDEIRVWNVARTAEQIAEFMNRELAGTEPGLAAYWKFNDGSGTSAADSSAHGNTGTLIGGPTWVEGASVCTPPPSGMVSWWPGDNSSIDIVSGNNGALHGAVTFAPGLVGQAFSLGGEVDDYVEIPNSPTLNPSTAFSIDGWFYIDPNDPANAGDFSPLVAKSSSGSAEGGWWLVFDDRSGYGYTKAIRFNVFTGTPGLAAAAEADNRITTPGWYHISGTFDQNASPQARLYINGLLAAQSGSPVTYLSNSIAVRIGAMHDREYYGGTQVWRLKGLADEIEFFNRVLTAEEIAAIYNAGGAGKCRSCVTLPSGMVSWWKGEDNALDIVGGNNGTLQGNATYGPGKVGQAFSFDGGENSYVEIPNTAALNPSGAFSVDGWFYINPAAPGNVGEIATLVAKTEGSTGNGWALYFDDRWSTKSLKFGLGTVLEFQNAIPTADWYHIAGVFDPSSSPNSKLYINGAMVASVDCGGATANSLNVRIGAMYWTDSYHVGNDRLNGKADEVEFFNRALTAEEIAAIYAAGSAGKCTPDTTPDSFTFTDQTGVALNTLIESNAITVTGINAASPISITGGEYSVSTNGGTTWSAYSATTPSRVSLDDQVKVRQTSSSSFSATTETTLTIGGVSDTFSLTTLAADTIPDAFAFVDQTGVALTTFVTSNSITVSGINTAAPISVAGGEYEINRSGTWTNAAATVNNSDTVKVRQTSSSNFSTTTDCTLTIGGVSDTFSVTTLAADTTPDAFAFTDQTGVALNTLVTSNSITVSGINTAAPISVTGGEYEINGNGTWTNAAGTVNNSDTVKVRQTSSSNFSTTTDCILTIDGVSDTFSVTTIDDRIGPSLSITSHSDGQHVSTSSITLAGTASDSGKGDNGVQQVTVNGVRASNDAAAGGATANWSKVVSLSPGANRITVGAYDDSSDHNSSSQSLTIYYEALQSFPFSDHFSSEKGWIGYEVGGWERKPAVGGGGENGNPDPGTDYSGSGDDYILGFAIGGDYPNDLSDEKAIVSPPVDCTGQTRVFLAFRRYLNVEGSEPASDVEGDYARIYVSTNGADWVEVWENPPVDLTDDRWVPFTLDISSIAANQARVYIKFTMGPTNSSRRFSGWNIDDLAVTSEAIYPSEGTMGTELTITGSGFGGKKGKVSIGGVSLTVLEWTDSLIRAVLPKPIDPGIHDVTIQPSGPKGTPSIIGSESFVSRSAEIYSVHQTEGSAYDQVTIEGRHFGTKKGSVYLEYGDGENVVRKSCKVNSWTMDPKTGDSEIVFVVPPMAPNVCDVVIDPYSTLHEAVEEDEFTVKAPEIVSVYPSGGSAGDQITIHGNFFGTKKGKVYLGYDLKGKPTKKSCSVVSWIVDPSTEEGDIVFVAPKALPPGAYDVIVTNSVGSDTLTVGFIIK